VIEVAGLELRTRLRRVHQAAPKKKGKVTGSLNASLAHQFQPTEKGDAMHLPFLLVEVAGPPSKARLNSAERRFAPFRHQVAPRDSDGAGQLAT